MNEGTPLPTPLQTVSHAPHATTQLSTLNRRNWAQNYRNTPVLSDNRISVRKADPIPCCIAYKSLILLYFESDEENLTLLLSDVRLVLACCCGCTPLLWGFVCTPAGPAGGPGWARLPGDGGGGSTRGLHLHKVGASVRAPNPRSRGLAALSFLIPNVRFSMVHFLLFFCNWKKINVYSECKSKKNVRH